MLDIRKLETSHFSKGHVLFKEGDHTLDIYILLEGGVAISKKNEHLAYIVERGSFIGEMSFLMKKVRTATATTIYPSDFVVINERNIESIIKSDPAIAVKMLRSLADRLNRTSAELIGIKNNRRITKVYEDLNEYIDDQPIEKIEEFCEKAVKNWLFSGESNYNFQNANKLFNRFQKDIKHLRSTKDFISHPYERLADDYGAKHLFLEYMQTEYDRFVG